MNEIGNEEGNMNNEIFDNYFGYYTPSFLVKKFYKNNQNENKKIANQIINSFTELRNYVIKKELILQKKSYSSINNKVENLPNEICQVIYFLHEAKKN